MVALYPAYADQPPGDGPIDLRSYGLSEWINDEELVELIKVSFGVDPEDQAT